FAENETDYYVTEQAGTASQLYNKTLAYLHTIYANPDQVLSALENQSITIRGYQDNAVRRTKMHVFDMDYSLVIRFKDGKLRFDAPSFKLTTFIDKLQTLHVYRKSGSLNGADLRIYSPRGLKSELAKQDLEDFFNGFIAGVVNNLSQDAANNDW